MKALLRPAIRLARALASKALDQNYVSHALLRNTLLTNYKQQRINVIYDIGAHKGDWASEMRTLMPNTRIILFEANPDHRDILEAGGFEHFIGILSKTGVTECEFYTTEASTPGSTGASYYKEVTPAFDNVTSRTLGAMPLDDLVIANKLPQPNLIKIDTQGSELDVIEGGLSTFRGAKWVLMELPTIEYNRSAPNIHEYLSKMDELGFLPIELIEVHKFGSTMIQLDFLFANKTLIDGGELRSLKIQS